MNYRDTIKELNEMDEVDEFDDDGFEEVEEGDMLSDELAKDLFDFFNSFIEESSLDEEFTNNGELERHFEKHCIGRNTNNKTIR